MRKRALSVTLVLALCLSLLPAPALAAETENGGTCPHHMEHTQDCGYAEPAAEVPCDMDCADADGDGVIDHADGCACAPASDGRPCGYVCRVCPVQALIDALPDGAAVTAENAEDVKARLDEIDEAKAPLTDGELDQLSTAPYEAAVSALLALEGMEGADEPETPEAPAAPVPAVENSAVAGGLTVTGGEEDTIIPIKMVF